MSHALANIVSTKLGHSLRSLVDKHTSEFWISLDLVWGERFIPVSGFADPFGTLSLASLVLASTQTQKAIMVNVVDVCADAVHNLHSNNVGNEGVLL